MDRSRTTPVFRAALFVLIAGACECGRAQHPPGTPDAGIAAAAPAAPPEMKSAEAFVRSLYSGADHPFDNTELTKEMMYDPPLVELMRADDELLDGSLGVLDFDPICACQDSDIRSVDVSVKRDGDGKAKATARFNNLGKATEVRFDLVTVKGAWRIYDIHEEGMPSMRKALEEEVAEFRKEIDADKETPHDALRTLSAVDGSCKRDDDCVWDEHFVAADGKCCSAACELNAVSNAWADRARAACAKLGWSKNCPTKECAAHRGFRCLSGKCEFTR